jgi:hypothetical protein
MLEFNVSVLWAQGWWATCLRMVGNMLEVDSGVLRVGDEAAVA